MIFELEEFCMQRTAVLRLCFGIFLVSLCSNRSNSQGRRSYPVPPAPAVASDKNMQPQVNQSVHLDTLLIQREAHEMAAIAATIPADIEQMRKGLLPQDVANKLKRIEKLSHQLRAQLRP
jgi:hypothetical protein